MFGGSGPMKIGDANVAAVVRTLQNANIPILGQDVGGSHGRRVEFDCGDGTMTVQCADRPPRTF